MRWCGVMSFGLLACGPGGGPEQDETVCGETPPMLESITAEFVGMYDRDGTMYPGVQVSGEASDADGDLTDYELEVWYDTLQDGEVDYSGSGLSYADTLDNAVCGVTDAMVGLILIIDGNSLGFETLYEVGMVLYDAEGNASNDGEPVLVEMLTPDADGNE